MPRSGATTFVGREEDLTRLHEQIQCSGQVAISAIAGMGGIGKTELALQYARRYGTGQDEVSPYGAVCWLQVRDQDVASQIVNFAQTYLALTPPDGLELVPQVNWVWAHWPVSQSVLLIYDDVANFDRISPYLPPQTDLFRVLITTRQRF
ncbi:MAG: ATP-binding protein, partial [Leptolyngbya sp. SIO1D8]|nr:ATP-binding protein [Leptolyngbya sp. SIO1D8]